MSVRNFLRSALIDVKDNWSSDKLAIVSGLSAPDALFGRRRELLLADIHAEWADWYVRGLLDPEKYVRVKNVGYAHIYSDALAAVRMTQLGLTPKQCNELASVVASYTNNVVQFLGGDARRRKYSREEKITLLALAGAPPRCWICGYGFSESAISCFLGDASADLERLPDFVDVLKPIGLNKRDLQIEIDHKLPFSRGGGDEDNLGLACGWCNKIKSDLMSVYESEGHLRPVRVRGALFSSLPQPFWVVRLLGVQSSCEHPAGCDRSSRNAEMTVTLLSPSGAPTPSNLKVTCYDHDPLREQRLQTRSTVEALWGR